VRIAAISACRYLTPPPVDRDARHVGRGRLSRR
jgi:hypothetical protein